MLVLFLLIVIDVLGYIVCQNYNNNLYLHKWRHIPFIWIFLFKYEKTYTEKQVKELFYHYKEKHLMRNNMQISKNEIDSFIDTNL